MKDTWAAYFIEDDLDVIELGVFESEQEARNCADEYNQKYRYCCTDPFKFASIIKNPSAYPKITKIS